jgi:hypothetical protein
MLFQDYKSRELVSFLCVDVILFSFVTNTFGPAHGYAYRTKVSIDSQKESFVLWSCNKFGSAFSRCESSRNGKDNTHVIRLLAKMMHDTI